MTEGASSIWHLAASIQLSNNRMFTARYIKHSKLLVRHAQKYLRYKADILDAALREQIEAAMRRD